PPHRHSSPTRRSSDLPPLRSRKVDSGFRLGFPREAFPRRAKLKCSLAFTPTHSGLPLDSSLKSMAPPAFAVDHTRTAKCPELLRSEEHTSELQSPDHL